MIEPCRAAVLFAATSAGTPPFTGLGARGSGLGARGLPAVLLALPAGAVLVGVLAATRPPRPVVALRADRPLPV
ncbi:hypothetical protein [Kitasatospora cineracea]|uniref:hypothetical protein n=1 Tax=Kitasatospora cineracea TaxID=88074 RepID=UPI000F4D837A|nr:hypothetical protein [Kitasatospora cineracea]